MLFLHGIYVWRNLTEHYGDYFIFERDIAIDKLRYKYILAVALHSDSLDDLSP